MAIPVPPDPNHHQPGVQHEGNALGSTSRRPGRADNVGKPGYDTRGMPKGLLYCMVDMPHLLNG